jgi:transcriptional regulator GlxA family with amidase domain
MRTSARTVAVVLFDEVELLDVAGPLQVLTLAGRHWNFRPFRVHTVSRQPGLIATRNQLRLEAADALDRMPRPEVLIVPGGYGARRALDDLELVEWLRVSAGAAELVISVGYGCLLLAKAGQLAHATVATTRETAELVTQLDPSITPDTSAAVVGSGKLLSAASSFAGIDATLRAVAQLLGTKLAQTVADTLGHGRNAALDSREPLRIDVPPHDAPKH